MGGKCRGPKESEEDKEEDRAQPDHSPSEAAGGQAPAAAASPFFAEPRCLNSAPLFRCAPPVASLASCEGLSARQHRLCGFSGAGQGLSGFRAAGKG